MCWPAPAIGTVPPGTGAAGPPRAAAAAAGPARARPPGGAEPGRGGPGRAARPGPAPALGCRLLASEPRAGSRLPGLRPCCDMGLGLRALSRLGSWQAQLTRGLTAWELQPRKVGWSLVKEGGLSLRGPLAGPHSSAQQAPIVAGSLSTRSLRFRFRFRCRHRQHGGLVPCGCRANAALARSELSEFTTRTAYDFGTVCPRRTALVLCFAIASGP